MNLLEEINKCQIIIKLHHLHQGGSKSTPKSQNCILLSCRCISVKIAWCVAPWFWMRSAPLEKILRNFHVSKWGKSGIVGKFWMSTFQPKWNFWIWCPFSPPKLESPKTTSCVSKKSGRKSFFASSFFLPSGGSKLDEISWKLLSKCIFTWKIQKCWVFLKRNFPSSG